MICDIVTPDGDPYEGDPRYVLKPALERMRSMGLDTFNVGPGSSTSSSRRTRASRRASTRAATSP